MECVGPCQLGPGERQQLAVERRRPFADGRRRVIGDPCVVAPVQVEGPIVERQDLDARRPVGPARAETFDRPLNPKDIDDVNAKVPDASGESRCIDPAVAENDVAAGAAGNLIIAAASCDEVASRPAVDGVVAAKRQNGVDISVPLMVLAPPPPNRRAMARPPEWQFAAWGWRSRSTRTLAPTQPPQFGQNCSQLGINTLANLDTGTLEIYGALSEQIGLSWGKVVRSVGGCAIPSGTSTAHPR